MGLFDFFKRKKLVNENEELEEANLLGESLHDKTIFNFKTIKREDHLLIEIDWLKKTGPIYYDNGNTPLHLDVLYTDDRLDVFANVKTTKKAHALINTIIVLNGGFSNFIKEKRNGYKLFYVGHKFSISCRYSIVGLIQVNIIYIDSIDEIKEELDITKVDYLYWSNLSNIISNAQKNAHIDNDKSYDYYENGQYQEGIESVKKALEIIPNDSSFYDTLALGYYYLGDYKLAIEASNNCIEIDIDKGTEKAEHYTTRAKINIKLNHIEKAIEDLRKALELEPNYEEAMQLLKSLK